MFSNVHEETAPARIEPGRVSQLDRFNVGNEPPRIVTQERGDHVEHGIREAADVQDVRTLRTIATLRLHGRVSC